MLEANRDITRRRQMEVELREANDRLESRVRERTAELSQTNESLHAAEERFRLLVEGAQDYANLMLDTAGHVVTWNVGAERCKGYRAEEIIGRHFSCFYPEEDIARGKPEKELKQVLAEGRCEDEGWRVRKDGSRFWARVVITPIHDRVGRLHGFAKVTRDITERMRAQERFRQAVESAPNGMVMIDPEGKILLVNAQTEKLFGYGRDEMLGQPVELLVPERLQAKHPEYRSGFFAKPQVRSMGVGRDLFGRRKDGSEFPVEIGLNPIDTEQGLVVLSAIVDITERKRADEAMRDRERMLGIVTGSARVGLVVVDAGYSYLFANEAYCELFGLADREIVGRRVSDVLAAGWSQIQPQLDRALAGERVAYELTLPPAPGLPGARFFTVVYEPRTVDGGARTVVVVVVDITERKRAEKGLYEREQTLRLFITHAPAAIAMFDLNMAYVSASHRWLTDYGLKIQDIIGRKHYDLFPEIPERWKEIHRRCLAGASEKCDEEQFPRQDGTVDWIRWEVLPWCDGNGAISGIIIFSETITQHKKAEVALRRLNDELQHVAHHLAGVNRDLKERTQENEAFVYSVSHDLRSPLVNLQGFSKELERSARDLRTFLTEGDLPPSVRTPALGLLDGSVAKSIRFIQTAVVRLNGIIDALLRLSRAGRVIYQRQRVDMQSVVTRIVDALKITTSERGASIQINDLPPTLGDSAALEQVFANLINNALAYLDGARPGRIEIGSVDAATADAQTYFVRDNGLGITESGKAKVFQPFQRLHPQVAPGEGLGLAIVQRVVERHGGSIWFESAKGLGSTFFVSLPTCPAQLAAGPPPVASDSYQECVHHEP